MQQFNTLDHCLREHPDKRVSLLKAEMFDTKLKCKADHNDRKKENLTVTPKKLSACRSKKSTHYCAKLKEKADMISPAKKFQKTQIHFTPRNRYLSVI